MSKRTGICSKCGGPHTGAHKSYCTVCNREYRLARALAHPNCSKCGEPKGEAKHHFYCEPCRKAWSKQNYAKNKAAQNARRVEWGRKNPERLRSSKLKQYYGITSDDYDRMAEDQGGACAVCACVPEGRLHVDHNHETGEVRALLCAPCNQALGLMREDLTLVMRLAWYVLEHEQDTWALPQSR